MILTADEVGRSLSGSIKLLNRDHRRPPVRSKPLFRFLAFVRGHRPDSAGLRRCTCRGSRPRMGLPPRSRPVRRHLARQLRNRRPLAGGLDRISACHDRRRAPSFASATATSASSLPIIGRPFWRPRLAVPKSTAPCIGFVNVQAWRPLFDVQPSPSSSRNIAGSSPSPRSVSPTASWRAAGDVDVGLNCSISAALGPH